MPLGLGKECERALFGGTVDPVAGSGKDPVSHLAVPIGKGAKLPQGDEAVLHVLYSRFHPPLLLWVFRRTGRDEETIGLCRLTVSPLHLGVVETGSRYGALCVVDNELFRYTTEKLEGTAVAPEPGCNRLIPDNLCVLVPAPAKRHDKDPGRDLLSRGRIHDRRPLAKVHLSGLCRLELEDDCRIRARLIEALKKPAYRGVASREPVFSHQGLMDGSARDPLLQPAADVLLVGSDKRYLMGLGWLAAHDSRNGGIIREGTVRGEPALGEGDCSYLGDLGATHEPGPGDPSVGFSHAHPGDDLPILVHLEPPVAHRCTSWLRVWNPGDYTMVSRSPRPQTWPDHRDYQVAPLSRSQSGPIRAIPGWLH
jgi:hypothetical protein